jgi:hypothetical protein
MSRKILLSIAAAWAVLSTQVLAQPYPATGESTTQLPADSVPIDFRGSRYFFSNGTWFQQVVAGYVVVTPPQGIVLPQLPPGAAAVWVGGVPYYSVNDVFYTEAPGGFMVVPAPVQQAAAPPPAESSASNAPFSFYYCASGKAYYPFVSDCPEGWRTVPGVPPNIR